MCIISLYSGCGGWDFGKTWYGIPCSEEYWETMTQIFERLKEGELKEERWLGISDKQSKINVELLKAFTDEVNRAYLYDATVSRKLVEYLIRVEGEYKVLSQDNGRLTIIRKFNIYGELNKPSNMKNSETSVSDIELPTEIVMIKMKKNSENTAEIYLNNGWQLSIQIQNISSKAEPSLKLVIRFEGMPSSVQSWECKWNQ